MTNPDFTQLQAEELEAWNEYRQALDAASVYRNRWLALYKDYAAELDNRRRKTIEAILEDRQPIEDPKQDREDRRGDAEHDRLVDRAA